jgi:exosortase/archaeosortase family protein
MTEQSSADPAATQGSTRPAFAGAGRAALALVLVAVSVAVLTTWQLDFRHGEALLAHLATSGLMDSTAVGDRWVVRSGSDLAIFIVTSSCSVSSLTVALFAFGVFQLLTGRGSVARVLSALAVGLTVLLLLGTARLSTIGVAWRHFEQASFWLTHDLIGTVISLISTVLAFAAMVLVVGRGRDAHRIRNFPTD